MTIELINTVADYKYVSTVLHVASTINCGRLNKNKYWIPAKYSVTINFIMTRYHNIPQYLADMTTVLPLS